MTHPKKWWKEKEGVTTSSTQETTRTSEKKEEEKKRSNGSDNQRYNKKPRKKTEPSFLVPIKRWTIRMGCIIATSFPFLVLFLFLSLIHSFFFFFFFFLFFLTFLFLFLDFILIWIRADCRRSNLNLVVNWTTSDSFPLASLHQSSWLASSFQRSTDSSSTGISCTLPCNNLYHAPFLDVLHPNETHWSLILQLPLTKCSISSYQIEWRPYFFQSTLYKTKLSRA